VIGWASLSGRDPAAIAVVLDFVDCTTNRHLVIKAWRVMRLDVATALDSPDVMFSGYRAFPRLEPGNYRLTIVQQAEDSYATTTIKEIAVP
jgi:hypothetical protein